MPNLPHHAWFHLSRRNRCWEIQIFRLFKMAVVLHIVMGKLALSLYAMSTWWSPAPAGAPGSLPHSGVFRGVLLGEGTPFGSGIRSPEGRRRSLPARYHRVTRYISTSLQHLTGSPVASDNIAGRAARWKGGADDGGHLFNITIYPPPSCSSP